MIIPRSESRTFGWTARARDFSLSLAVMAAAIAGCGEPTDTTPAGGAVDTADPWHVETGSTLFVDSNRRILSPQVGEGQLALGTSTDASGFVTTQIVECVSGAGENLSVSCDVDPGFVTVGGGAWAEYSGAGALLTASFPKDQNLTGWSASSKDHLQPDVHRLHVYAIGLMLKGLSRQSLFSKISILQTTSNQDPHPTATTPITTGSLVVLGGGARVDWTSPGNLLTTSVPGCFIPVRGGTPLALCWQAASKDHILPSPATITTFAIAIPQTIAGWGTLDVKYLESDSSSVATGVASANAQVPAGYVLAAIGGSAQTDSGPGRMLFRMSPAVSSNTAILVQSKDHVKVSAGNASAFAVVVKKAP